MQLLDSLQWRYATKRMNGKLVSKNDMDKIIASVGLAPTSMGMQAFKVINISSPDILNAIFEKAAPDQQMLLKCSNLLVFANYTSITEKDMDECMELLQKTRNYSQEKIDLYRKGYCGFIDSLEAKGISVAEWTARQTYIVMGYASVMAASLGVDSTPMEGFDPDLLNEILDLDSQGLHTCVLLALGYRDEDNDHLVNFPKVRKPLNELITDLR